MYQGEYFQIEMHGELAHLVFNSQHDSVNTLTEEALKELEQAVTLLEESKPAGLVIRSGKKLFSAGADVKAFRQLFTDGGEAVATYLEWAQGLYNRIEDLPLPKVALINGTAAGGGMELTLTADYRLATPDAKLSLPEVKLGIFPAWGGLTRLPRIAGMDTAIAWMTMGKNFKAADALTAHVIDGVVEAEKAVAMAEQTIESAIKGELNWQARFEEKQQPLPMSRYELSMSINVARGMAAKVAGKHYPTPGIILSSLEKAAKLGRDESMGIERSAVWQCIETGVPDALVSVFLSDMAVKSRTKSLVGDSQSCSEVGVIGAGIMGGGIAYVSADKGMDVVMKDIHKQGLKLGLDEANKLLTKQVERGRKKPGQMGETLNRIVPTLHNETLQNNDLIIEAVVENPKVKEVVLSELEQIAPNALIASNTSTLMISGLAQALECPERFCGIHFFNPVHRMPLVEVIRGEQTSDETISQAVKYVADLGKTPIVVNDCAGFLVNRCLTPYFLAFNQLVLDGGDIAVIDKVMSKGFGWPMGPAHLLDVIGLDTAAHCIDVMDEAFPGRLSKPETNLIQSFVDQQLFGQKSGQGFYTHVADRRGRIKPQASPEANNLILSLAEQPAEFDVDAITMRMMLPMMFEAIRCLDEGIVASPSEADIAMIYGTGFPPFRGGLFYYMDQIGADKLLETAEQYKHLGALYEAPKGLIERAKNGKSFY
ncbi:fatty acid oxidation complex subunit alpha FadB [Vibrio sp. CAU 1672]|uniref:fatty acid oxidation complex subunit alpha FadB n=1 Tax=Vibrio sp. CAU 1672 TaxID=3032594 RepID=UPI0023DC080F|nr:fatty acid oxidation complex subunit alpha FadB [Vibrio sp. CAU 1672]MDF2152814.1 fatty acid oxidation complex subunit alpha FadB [Vibrio sp. CAU 1672]